MMVTQGNSHLYERMSIWLVLSCVVGIERCDAQANESIEYMTNAQKLYSFLFRDYNKYIPPVNTKGRDGRPSPYINEMGLIVYYARLLSLDEPEQTINMIVEYDITWWDVRLKWNPADFDDISVLIVNREQVWVPDIKPYDCSSYTELKDPYQQNAIIRASGSLSLYSTAVISSLCQVQISDFPFDNQQCHFRLSSYALLASEISISPRLGPSFSAKEMSNGEWTVTNVTAETEIVDIGIQYTTAFYVINISRSSIYYVILIIAPSFIMTFLCVTGMFWSEYSEDNYMERLNLGFAAILAMAMVLQIAASSVPKTTQIPDLSIYNMVNLLLITAAIVIVLSTSKVKERKKKSMTERIQRNPTSCNLHSFLLLVFPLITILNLLYLIRRPIERLFI